MHFYKCKDVYFDMINEVVNDAKRFNQHFHTTWSSHLISCDPLVRMSCLCLDRTMPTGPLRWKNFNIWFMIYLSASGWQNWGRPSHPWHTSWARRCWRSRPQGPQDPDLKPGPLVVCRCRLSTPGSLPPDHSSSGRKPRNASIASCYPPGKIVIPTSHPGVIEKVTDWCKNRA